MLKSHYFIFTILLFFSKTLFASDKVLVITTIPDLAEVVRDVGGDLVEVESLLSGLEDAHYMDATPTFIKKVSKAQIVCLVGLDLEIGWMPKILMKSGNAQVQPGGNGYCDVGSVVSALEKSITPVDRSMGDVHPAGNPHFQLSPKALAEGAVVVAKTLSTQRPESAIFFQNNLVSFQKKMNELHNTINQKIQPLLKSSFAVIEYHKDFSYFLNSYNIPTFGSIEEKPGVPPSAARLASTALNAKKSQIRMALGSLYVPEKHLQKFSQISSIPFKKMPTMVQVDNEKFNSIEKVQHALADSLLQNLAE